jgi:hypothetical protein
MGGKVHKEYLFPSRLYLTLFIGSSQSNMLSLLVILTFFQNTLKIFKQIFRLRCKCLSVFGEYVESI